MIGNKVSKSISQNMRKRRIELGLTQRDLHARTRITQGNISNLERGRTKNPSLSMILRVSKALEVTPSQLTGLQL